MIESMRNAWRKNAPELVGLSTGATPDFVLARRPVSPLPGVPVFGFHLVQGPTFEADLAFLTENDYTTLGATELVDYLAGRSRVPERSVVLTFDDGPRNFHEVAFPLLRRFGHRAVAFIAPGLHAEQASAEEGSDRPLTWPEIREIHASGLVDFQSHTLESRYVPRWPEAAALAGCAPRIEAVRRGPARSIEDDLDASRGLLEEKLPGSRIRHLAFPMYVGSDEAVAAGRKLGFEGFFWGLLPGRPMNRQGESASHISRLSDEFLRRLPGVGRISYSGLLRERWRRVQEGRAWRRRYSTV